MQGIERQTWGCGLGLALVVGVFSGCGGVLGPEDGSNGAAGSGGAGSSGNPSDPSSPGTPGNGAGTPSAPGDGGNGGGNNGGQDPSDGPVMATGLSYWNAQCASCHGDFQPDSVLSSGDVNGDFRLDAAAAVAEHGADLAAYIAETMPLGDVAACQGDCAELTATYIEGFREAITPDNCAAEAPRGARRFQLLSSREYQRSLEHLLGVPADYGELVANNDAKLGGFTNMRRQVVNGTVLDQYIRNAEAIADWAIRQGRPFTCTTDCASRFVNEFLPRVFRGRVPADQADAYRDLFADFPDQGLQLALTAALSSPNFLYRLEAGVDAATARAEGYYDPTATPPGTGGSGSASSAADTITAAELTGPSGSLAGDVWALYENGTVGFTFSADWTDPAALEVRARGTNFGEVWPELTVRVGGQTVGVVEVNRADLQTYRIDVTGVTGRPRVDLAFENDGGEPPYDAGRDANLFIAQVELLVATPGAPPPADPDPTDPQPSILDQADDQDFVLRPLELASALSFMLTGSTPDAQLLAAAQAGGLSTEAQIRAQAERLLDSARGREHLGDFVVEWFGLDAVETANRPGTPELTPAVKAAMVEEVRQHFLHVVFEDAPYSEFFGGDYTFLNDDLAAYYGVSGNFGDTFQKVSVPGRGGPIASGAFMTANAHTERSAPILRAVRAREKALCHYIDPPNAPIAGDDIDEQRAQAQARVAEREQEAGALSSREFYFLYTDQVDACAACHEKIINPMFGMEDFDHVGRKRPSAGPGQVIETIHGTEQVVSLEGTLYGVDSTGDPNSLEFSGAKDFSNQIADTPAVQRCLVRKSFRWMTGLPLTDRDVDVGRREDLSADQRRARACVQQDLTSLFANANQDPRALLLELATERLMWLRR